MGGLSNVLKHVRASMNIASIKIKYISLDLISAHHFAKRESATCAQQPCLFPTDIAQACVITAPPTFSNPSGDN